MWAKGNLKKKMAKLLDYIRPENPSVNHVLRKSLGYPSVTKATVKLWCHNTVILEKLQDSYCLLVGLRAINTVIEPCPLQTRRMMES